MDPQSKLKQTLERKPDKKKPPSSFLPPLLPGHRTLTITNQHPQQTHGISPTKTPKVKEKKTPTSSKEYHKIAATNRRKSLGEDKPQATVPTKANKEVV
ncbi:hypothetical protein C1H46_004977 [Malus baccata]|uniref:Uncharacterized protein n=1 Tax=Malus baccata TaxID=106549 RepID=A0A540NEL2_MALBA|nr:hypothetical protein C1H46_004977 [Malus baccata]